MSNIESRLQIILALIDQAGVFGESELSDAERAAKFVNPSDTSPAPASGFDAKAIMEDLKKIEADPPEISASPAPQQGDWADEMAEKICVGFSGNVEVRLNEFDGAIYDLPHFRHFISTFLRSYRSPTETVMQNYLNSIAAYDTDFISTGRTQYRIGFNDGLRHIRLVARAALDQVKKIRDGK